MNVKKNIFWTLGAILIAFLTIKTVFSQNRALSIPAILKMLDHASVGWLIATFISMLGFIVFEGLAIRYLLNHLGYKTSFFNGLLYSASDQFFSAITPSATGGQPASALFMRTRKIPTSAITVCLLANLIMYTLSTLVIGISSVVVMPEVFENFDSLSRFFIIFGTVCMAALTVLFYILLRHSSFLRRFETVLLGFLHKLHIIRDLDSWNGRIEKHIADYKLCAKMLSHKAPVLVVVFFLNLAQRVSQISVTPLLNVATRKAPTTGRLVELWIVQALSQIGSYCVPIPGGMGVADYLMIDGFTSMFNQDYAYLLQTLSRSISFYICTLISLVIVVIGYVLLIIKGHKEKS